MSDEKEEISTVKYRRLLMRLKNVVQMPSGISLRESDWQKSYTHKNTPPTCNAPLPFRKPFNNIKEEHECDETCEHGVEE